MGLKRIFTAEELKKGRFPLISVLIAGILREGVEELQNQLKWNNINDIKKRHL
jgi:hypothetical protein